MVVIGAIAFLADSVPPLTPDGDEARRWAEEELSKPAYAEAEPTLFDRVARAIGDFLGRLFSTQLDGPWGSAFAIIAAVVVVALIILAFVVWGVPRARHRSRVAIAELFGESDARSAAELRADAERAAERSDWDAAIVLRFRALARAVVERGVVEAPPGTTVHGFARRTGRAFPASADALEEAAKAFDDVRYLRRPGTESLYRRVATVDAEIARSRPVELSPLGTGIPR